MSKIFVECKSVGVYVPEKMAYDLDAIVKELPQEYRTPKRMATVCEKSEFKDGEEGDLSWITTKAVDMVGDIVEPSGIDKSVFEKNPIVLWNHDHNEPVGYSPWQEVNERGIKAKTLYTKRPKNWVGEWKPSYIFELTKAGVLRAKSIGFIPLQIDEPNDEEKSLGIQRRISKSVMFEYSSVSIPCNSEALCEAVSKGFNPNAALLAQLGIAWKSAPVKVPVIKKPEPAITARIKATEKRIEDLMKKWKSKAR